MKNQSFVQEMPCHKYIFPKLGSEADAMSYERMLVDVLTVCGCNSKDIELALTLQQSRVYENPALADYDFTSWRGVTIGDDLINSIRLDSSVAVYKKCNQLYGKYDGRMTACKICPLSKKYVNGNLLFEKRLLRYMYESKENYEHFLSAGICCDHFTFLYDLMEQGKSEKPCLFALTKHLFNALADSDIRDEYFSTGSHSFTPSMKSHMVKSVKLAKPPRAYMSADWTLRFTEFFEEQLFSTPLCTSKEAERAFAKICKSRPAKERTTINAKGNLGASDISPAKKKTRKQESSTPMAGAGESSGPVGLEKLLTKVSEPTEPPFDESEPTFYEVDETTLENTVSVYELFLPTCVVQPYASNCISSEELGYFEDNMEHPTVVDESVEEEPIVEEPVVEDERMGQGECEDSAHAESTVNVRELARTGTALLDIPKMSLAEIETFSIVLDAADVRMLTIFENGVLKSKMLCIEVVSVEDALVLLMWVPKLRSFFSCGLKCRDILAPLLSHKSVRKVCFHPYVLYSILATHDIVLKNVFSLLTAYGLLHKCAIGEFYEDLFLHYNTIPAASGVTFKPVSDYQSSLIGYMPSYPFVMRKQLREISSAGLDGEFSTTCCYDECLGLSYSRNRFLDSGTFLFAMVRPGVFSFIENECRECYVDGVFLTYCILKSVKEPEDILRDILIIMSEQGRFRTNEIMITNIKKDSFTLFVESSLVEFITSIVNVTFLGYIDTAGEKGLEIYECREHGHVVERGHCQMSIVEDFSCMASNVTFESPEPYDDEEVNALDEATYKEEQACDISSSSDGVGCDYRKNIAAVDETSLVDNEICEHVCEEVGEEVGRIDETSSATDLQGEHASLTPEHNDVDSSNTEPSCDEDGMSFVMSTEYADSDVGCVNVLLPDDIDSVSLSIDNMFYDEDGDAPSDELSEGERSAILAELNEQFRF